MPDETIKVTFAVRPMAKERLKSLKLRLLEAGFHVSESSLIERLLAPGFLAALEANIKESPCKSGTVLG
jgi:hypothetical protein